MCGAVASDADVIAFVPTTEPEAWSAAEALDRMLDEHHRTQGMTQIRRETCRRLRSNALPDDNPRAPSSVMTSKMVRMRVMRPAYAPISAAAPSVNDLIARGRNAPLDATAHADGRGVLRRCEQLWTCASFRPMRHCLLLHGGGGRQ
jgi:hypothetical protein